MMLELVKFIDVFVVCWIVSFSTKCFSLVLDKGTINTPKGQTYELKCQNVTDGEFALLVWTSNAYSGNAKKTVYKYSIDAKEEIKPEFAGRIQRINQTSLRITDARIGDSGNWECNIIFKYTPKDAPPRLRVEELAIYKLVVIGLPKSLQISSDLVEARHGENTSVFCDVQGQSSFDVTWRKLNGSFSSNVHFTNITKSTDGYFIQRNHMTFVGFSRENEGIYECTASNIGGTSFKRVSAHVLTVPMIYGRQDFNINVYDTGKIVCKAKGYPKIQFLWKFYVRKRNLTSLGPSDHVGKYSVSKTKYDNVKSIGISELTIERVQKHDLDHFTCIATNRIGSHQKDIKLHGYAPPDAPKIIQSEINSYTDKVSLAWSLGSNGGKPITSITIKYKNSSSTKGWTTLQITQSFTEYTVNNLHHSTRYDFRVLATNEIGDGEYSNIVSAETLPIEPATIEPVSGSTDFFSQFSIPAMIGIIGGAALAVIIAIACICVFVQRIKDRESKNTNIPISATTFAPTTSLMRNSSVDGAQVEMDRIIRTDEWEFPRDRLTITTVLGAGAFGVVMRGLAQGIKGSVGQITVAVKTVRDPNNEAATKDLMAELNLLKVIPEHPNVLGLLGCCTRSEPLYVIVEYCANGDLQGFLRSSRGIYERYYKTSYGGTIPNLTSKMILTFAWQIAKGMAHLSAMKVIHRDLASRNVLVDDQLTCKVSDFGFARDIYLEDHYLKRSAGGRFPIKWMAIESLLDGISTTKSDVWSFGVVLWELITLGASPYPGMSSYEVVSFLQDGYRMDKPKHASNEVYALMMDCWSVSPGRRPSFNEVADRCQELVHNSEELINMSFYQDHLYVNFDSTGTGSAAVSTTTTPHGTLGRDRTNNIQHPYINPPQTPKTLRSTSQISVRSGGRHNSITESRHNVVNGNSRSNSITGLSDRSATGVSNVSNRDERAALLPPIPQ